MSPVPFTFQEILRRLVLRLVLMVDCAVSRRMAGLRGRLASMGAGHRHRRRVTRALAQAERSAAILADPAFWADARTVGKAMEVARIVRDAGRRAYVRCVIWPTRVRRLRGCAAGQRWPRCRRGMADVRAGWGMGGFAGRACGSPPSPNPRPRGERAFCWGLGGNGGGVASGGGGVCSG